MRGVSRQESFQIILENYSEKLSQEDLDFYLDKKNTIYKNLLQDMTSKDLSDEVKHTLILLKNRGIKLAIGSSSKNARLILDRLGLGNFFDAISDGNGISKAKPDPEIFRKAAELLNVPNSACLVVEDAEVGVDAARNGGMDCCAFGEVLSDYHATYHITFFHDLLSIVV